MIRVFGGTGYIVMKPQIAMLFATLLVMPTLSAAQEAGNVVQPRAMPDRRENDQAFSGFVSVGPGIAPKYAGSKNYIPIPFVTAYLRYKGVALEMFGRDIRVNFGGQSGFVFGPAMEFDLGRSKSDSETARYLNKIPFEVDAGGFVGYRFGGDAHGQGQVSFEVMALADISNASNGFKITPAVSYALLRGSKWILNVDAGITYADKKNLRTYFGVTPAESLASGLAAYAPGAGFRNIGVGALIGYQFNQHWGVTGRVGYDYYLGDIARSPIVKTGSRNQLVTGVALSYGF